MQKKILYEKDQIELNVRNLFKEGRKVSLENNKTENAKWRSANEQLRSSSDSNGHYTQINDGYCKNATANSILTENKTNEGTITEVHTRDSDIRLDRSTRPENTYLTFLEDFPESVSTDENGIYSYATKSGHQVVSFGQRKSRNLQNSYLSLGTGSQKDYKTSTSTEHAASNQQFGDKGKDPKHSLVRYDNDRRQIFESTASPNEFHANLLKSKHNDDAVIIDNYLIPIQITHFHEKEFYDKGSPFHTFKEENEYSLPVEMNSSDLISRNSLVDAVQVPEHSRKRSKSRLVVLIVVILVTLLAAAVSAVTVVLTKSEGNIGDCVDGNGCTSKCNRYPNVPNGRSNSTETILPASSIRVTCDPGFKINRKDTAFCQKNGSWNVILRCEPIDCGKYQPLEHVRLIEHKYGTTFNNTVHLACDTGFQFETKSDMSVWCNENGIWMGNPKCENIVEFSVEPSFLLIGDVGKLTCNFRETPNWQKVDLTRISSDDDSMVIVSIDNFVDSYKTKINGDNIRVSDRSFTHDSGIVVVIIDTVQCQDTFGIPGDVKYRCFVTYQNNLIAFNDRTIRIQGQPGAPSITISDQVVEGQDTQMARAFICEMYFPEPDGHIIIESDYNSEISTLLTTVNDIFFKEGNTYTVGSSLTIVCIVEDFQGLEDIQITRGNGELVSSVNIGDNIKGFQSVSSSNYLNSTSGILSLYVDHLLCSDEAAYRCIPVGNGKPSADVINLDLNCS